MVEFVKSWEHHKFSPDKYLREYLIYIETQNDDVPSFSHIYTSKFAKQYKLNKCDQLSKYEIRITEKKQILFN